MVNLEDFILHNQLIQDLFNLGLRPGDLVMVHASMRAVGHVLGGPDMVIQALLDVLGPTGTIMAYTDWEFAAQHFTVEQGIEALEPRLLEAWPAFDPRTARARRDYGVFPEFLRTWPGAQRSGNPGASVAALGARAVWLCQDHPLNYGYGPGSPLAKLVEAMGKVLLLGSPLDSVTLLHYAEHLANLPGKRVIRYQEPLLINGVKTWVTIEEFDTSQPVVASAPENYFELICQQFLDAGKGSRGVVGKASSTLFDAAALVQFAVRWMEEHYGERRKSEQKHSK